MDLSKQIMCLVLLFCLEFALIRAALSKKAFERYSSKTYKKRRKNATLKERFFYTHWKNDIPKRYFVCFYAVIIVYGLALISCVVLRFITASNEYGTVIVKCFVNVVFAWAIIRGILFGIIGDTELERKKGKKRKK